MKVRVTRTSDFGREALPTTKIPITEETVYWGSMPEKQYWAEINSIEELKAWIESEQSPIILNSNGAYVSVEIYDTYREQQTK